MASSLQTQIILGSASKPRQQILQEMGFKFEVQVAGVDEAAIRRPTAEELVVALAEAKADAICARLADRIAQVKEDGTDLLLITADQVVVHEGRILEKPKSEQEAREFIKGYSRSPATTVSGVMVTNLRTGARRGGVEKAEVYFYAIPEDVVNSLIEEGLVYACAGGLVVEHPLVSPFVETMVGTLDSVMGLPKALTSTLLQASQ